MEKVKFHFPDTKTGLKKLDFYCFPGISFAGLFQRIFHMEGPNSANKQPPPTALLAILKP